MKPTARSVRLVAGLALLSLGAPFSGLWLQVWMMLVAIWALFLLLDMLLLLRLPRPSARRRVEHALPLGVWREVLLTLENAGNTEVRVRVADFYPPEFRVRDLPFSAVTPPKSRLERSYGVRAEQRGLFRFQAPQLLLSSPLQLWELSTRPGEAEEVKVYPNFQAAANLALMDTNQRLTQMGVHKRRRRGEGREFHQLREFVQGDSLRLIDWKATSRMRKIISREFRDERDQQVIFLLDCGQSMRSQDGALSHFDHALNAVLMLSAVALRGGDAVGLITFGGQERRLAARKGSGQLNLLLSQTYDIQPGLQTSDFLEVARQVLVHCRKRSLLVLVTNLKDDDDGELNKALKMLRRKHLVLLAGTRERILHEVLEEPIHDLEDALRTAGVHTYLKRRKQTFEALKTKGVICVEVLPEQLPVHLVNNYLDIKSKGLL
ncbi:MAG: DUF58 domain-containing protein [Acidobacteriota bacterium]|nr:DUF58 domain-containing protein [Acidobacteriota bacterium]